MHADAGRTAGDEKARICTFSRSFLNKINSGVFASGGTRCIRIMGMGPLKASEKTKERVCVKYRRQSREEKSIFNFILTL
jgi:hypothetical protein